VRGQQDPQPSILAFVDVETRRAQDDPLRMIKRLADEALSALSPLPDGTYFEISRPSIPPKRPLKAALLGDR
jgi:hypothetical protein